MSSTYYLKIDKAIEYTNKIVNQMLQYYVNCQQKE